MSLEDTGAAPAAADTTPVADSAPAAPAEASTPTIDDTLSAVWDKAQTGQERDEGGRFKAKDAPTEAAPAPKDTTAKDSETPRPEGTAPAKLPLAWKHAPEEFAALPPKAQEFILAQEKHANDGFQKQAEKYKPYDELDKLFEPRRERWALSGETPTQKVQQLLAAQDFLDRDAPGAIKWLMDAYRIDPRQLFPAAPQQQDQQYVDPQVQALRQELEDIKAREYQRQQAEFATQVNSVQSEIETFGKSHELFEEVRQDMVPFIQAGKSLQDAYDAAVWANPVTRAKQLEQQRSKDAEKVKAEAEKARAASAINVRSSPAGASPRTMDDTLRQTAARLYG